MGEITLTVDYGVPFTNPYNGSVKNFSGTLAVSLADDSIRGKYELSQIGLFYNENKNRRNIPFDTIDEWSLGFKDGNVISKVVAYDYSNKIAGTFSKVNFVFNDHTLELHDFGVLNITADYSYNTGTITIKPEKQIQGANINVYGLTLESGYACETFDGTYLEIDGQSVPGFEANTDRSMSLYVTPVNFTDAFVMYDGTDDNINSPDTVLGRFSTLNVTLISHLDEIPVLGKMTLTYDAENDTDAGTVNDNYKTPLIFRFSENVDNVGNVRFAYSNDYGQSVQTWNNDTTNPYMLNNFSIVADTDYHYDANIYPYVGNIKLIYAYVIGGTESGDNMNKAIGRFEVE